MRRVLRVLPAAWLVLLLLLPLGAWALGSRQTNLENRPPTPVPTLDRGTLGHEATFAQLDKAIVDRLPLRQHAIEARGRLAVDLFHDSPNADVAIGRDGWLYYRPELQTCAVPEYRPAADPADAAEIVARTLVASGRRAGVLVAGSKVATHDDDLRGLDEDDVACVRALEARIHERLRTTPGGLDVQAQLEALERRGRPTFLKTDTHWNATGREVFVRAVLDRIRPGLADAVGLERGPSVERPGDLGRFLGLERHDDDETVRAVRTPSRPFRAGEVLLVGDSQMDLGIVAPFATPSIAQTVLPGQPFCTWPQLDAGGCDRQVQDARTVVTEIVGRNVRDLVHVCWRTVSLVGGDLRGGRAATWERTDGGAQDADAVT
ncbi:alginate O-acetyltransferase AlgX-related protein, partial [Patulibacter sp. S7RM1-6]